MVQDTISAERLDEWMDGCMDIIMQVRRFWDILPLSGLTKPNYWNQTKVCQSRALNTRIKGIVLTTLANYVG